MLLLKMLFRLEHKCQSCDNDSSPQMPPEDKRGSVQHGAREMASPSLSQNLPGVRGLRKRRLAAFVRRGTTLGDSLFSDTWDTLPAGMWGAGAWRLISALPLRSLAAPAQHVCVCVGRSLSGVHLCLKVKQAPSLAVVPPAPIQGAG